MPASRAARNRRLRDFRSAWRTPAVVRSAVTRIARAPAIWSVILSCRAKQIRQRLVEAGGPKHLTIRIDQLRGHPHAVAGPTDAAFDLVARPRDCGRSLPGLRVCSCTGRRRSRTSRSAPENRPSALMMSCVKPSAKYSRAESSFWLRKGRTAIAAFAPISGLLIVDWSACPRRPDQFPAGPMADPEHAAAATRTANVSKTNNPMRAPSAAIKRGAARARQETAPAIESGSGKTQERVRHRPETGSLGNDPTRQLQIDSRGAEPSDQARPVVSERPSQFADALHQRIIRDGNIRPDCGKELVLRDKPGADFR